MLSFTTYPKIIEIGEKTPVLYNYHQHLSTILQISRNLRLGDSNIYREKVVKNAVPWHHISRSLKLEVVPLV